MIMVDEEYNEFDNKFGYTNKEGVVEYVQLESDYGSIIDFHNNPEIYIEDIPKLIKALEAAKTYAEGLK